MTVIHKWGPLNECINACDSHNQWGWKKETYSDPFVCSSTSLNLAPRHWFWAQFVLYQSNILHAALNCWLWHLVSYMGNQICRLFYLTWCLNLVPQDVLTDLSAECENLPVEGVSGACYAHKVIVLLNSILSTCLCRCLHHSRGRLLIFQEINACMCLLLQGICQAANYIYKKLVNDGILNQAFNIAPVRSVTEVKDCISAEADSTVFHCNSIIAGTSEATIYYQWESLTWMVVFRQGWC